MLIILSYLLYCLLTCLIFLCLCDVYKIINKQLCYDDDDADDDYAILYHAVIWWRLLLQFCRIYTVGHKKHATLFWIIIQRFLMHFHTLCTYKNRKKYSVRNYKICNVTTTVSLHYLRKFENTQNSTTVGDSSCLMFDRTSRAQPSQKVL